jgi:glyoxylase I family protein
MSIDGFNHINLRAPRALLDELRRFYIEVIGLQQGPRPAFRSYGYWLYAQGRDIVHLTEARPAELRATHTATTFDHIAFTCTNLPAVEARLHRHGINYTVDHVPMTRQRQLFLSDPAGNGIELNFTLDT